MSFEKFFANYIEIKNEVEQSMQDPTMTWSFEVSNNFTDKDLLGNIIVRTDKHFSVRVLYDEEFEKLGTKRIAKDIVRELRGINYVF